MKKTSIKSKVDVSYRYRINTQMQKFQKEKVSIKYCIKKVKYVIISRGAKEIYSRDGNVLYKEEYILKGARKAWRINTNITER